MHADPAVRKPVKTKHGITRRVDRFAALANPNVQRNKRRPGGPLNHELMIG